MHNRIIIALIQLLIYCQLNASRVTQIQSVLNHPMWPPWQRFKEMHISNELFNQLRSPHVGNLDRFIGDFTSSQCIIFINSFGRSIPTSSSQYPVIVRNLVPLTIPSEMRVLWGPGTLISTNVTISSNLKLRCPISNFFLPSYYNEKNGSIGSLCFQLDFVKFTQQEKSWNCDVQIGLFTEPYKIYKDLISHQESTRFPKLAFSILRAPSLNIFVSGLNAIRHINLVLLFIENCNSVKILLFFVTRFNLSVMFVNPELAPIQAVITDIKLLSPCSHDKTLVDDFESAVVYENNQMKSLSELQEMALPSISSNLMWNLSQNLYSGDNVFVNMMKHMLACRNSTEILEFPEERIGREYARIWFAIMGNYTVKMVDSFCVNGFEEPRQQYLRRSVKLHFSPYVRGLNHFPSLFRIILRIYGLSAAGKRATDQSPSRSLSTCLRDGFGFS